MRNVTADTYKDFILVNRRENRIYYKKKKH